MLISCFGSPPIWWNKHLYGEDDKDYIWFNQLYIVGFNCGEAANIATPEWLRVAKEAAIRRASINCPPMVSHSQLLYDLALALCSRFDLSFTNNFFSAFEVCLKERLDAEFQLFIKFPNRITYLKLYKHFSFAKPIPEFNPIKSFLLRCRLTLS